jgi:hypothetical protein
MCTPIAFIIFNRPDTTERVFAEIARAKPPKLFVIADGPRDDCPDDIEKCAAARAVIDSVDWECDVLKNYSDVNLGCGRRPAMGINWVFENTDEAIILEDDCLPHPSFFFFCEELLERYHDDERVMMISGRNGLFGQRQIAYSYSFRLLVSCWGWATWRRAWKHYDIEMKLWPELRNMSWLQDIFGDHRAVEYWRSILDRAHAGGGNVDYWDYQWIFNCWAQYGLGVVPDTNLVQNIGFGGEATHTKLVNDTRVNLPVAQMAFPLRHPPYVVRDREAERLLFERLFSRDRNRMSLYRRMRRKLSAVSSLLRG